MDDRVYDRTHQLVPVETRSLRALVIGAGMVGSWTTAALARMVSHVTVVDYDTIEEANVGVQLYTPADVGEQKIYALANYCIGLPVKTVQAVIPVGAYDGWTRDTANLDEHDNPTPVWWNWDFDVVVSAIDSMAGREYVATQSMRQGVPLFIDIRVMGEMVCVLTATHEAVVTGREYLARGTYGEYLKTILPDDAVDEVDCGSEGTVYSGLFAAQRVAAIVNNWGRGMKPPAKEVWNVATVEDMYRQQQEEHGNQGSEEGHEEGGEEARRQEGDTEATGQDSQGHQEGDESR